MESRSEPYVFVSYSYQDKEFVDHLVSDLGSRGLLIKYDTSLLSPGDPIRETLMKSLKNANVVLIVITERSIQSGNVMSELGMALEITNSAKNEKLLVPLICGNVQPPYNIADTRAVYMRQPDVNSPDYVKAIADIEKIIAPFLQNQLQASRTKQTSKNTRDHLDRRYWLLKMNPQTWIPEHLKVDQQTFFSTFYFGEKRPEYEMFLNINEGDLVLGYLSGDEEAIVCEMLVTSPVGPDTKQGEVFKMRVIREIKPRILLENIRQVIPVIANKLLDNNRPPRLFFLLKESEYDKILNTNIKPYQNNYLPFFQTEGNHLLTQDQLDFENDINSFATIICLKKVKPPLAIGLFGNWGSGKSFFMEKLAGRIDNVSKSKDSDNVEHVVQVKFNSWHYSDANLWASLTTQIFESLHDYAQKRNYGEEAIKSIYKELNITSYQLEEAKNKIRENEIQLGAIEERKRSIEKVIEKKKESLDLWSGKELIKIVLRDPYIQSDFQKLKEEFNEEDLIKNITEIDQKLGQFANVGGQIYESFNLLKKNRSKAWYWVWGIALLCALIGYLLLGPLKQFVTDVINGGYIVTGLFLVWLGNLIDKLGPYFRKINQFYKRLKSLKQTIEREKEHVRLKEHQEAENLQKDIDSLISRKAELEIEKINIEQKKSRLASEINDIGSGKLLASFLEGKSVDESYIKQLGIISWIRKDFAKLNELFENQTFAQKEGAVVSEVKIDRIVLYIDDLDRCNEDVVVKVLQAIHLLLAFPLFVVVVGVDPRWLNNAVTKKFKDLFGDSSQSNSSGYPNNDAENGNQTQSMPATSYDYLEKIFQIPFALKSIDAKGRNQLIKYLLREELGADNNSTTSDLSLQVSDRDDQESELNYQSYQSTDNDRTIGANREIDTGKPKAKKSLKFTEQELKYLQIISALFGKTPRTIKRYVNIYRLIKAHDNLKIVDNFSVNDFAPIMFSLAVIVGYPTLAELYIRTLQSADQQVTFKEFLKSSPFPANFKLVITNASTELQSMKMMDVTRNLELVSRFSFRTILN